MTSHQRSVRLGVLVTGMVLAGTVMLPGPAIADDAGTTPASGESSTAVTVPADQSVVQPDASVEQVAAASRTPKAAGPRGGLLVGDSLMVSVTPWMRAQGFRVHAKVGRQFSTAPGIVRSFGAKLPRNVVVELGTNGTVSLSACRSVVNTAGKYRRVFLVTARVPRSWEAGNIRTLRACDASFAAKRVRIIDWYGHSAGHPEWFGADRVHLSGSGREAFQRLITAAVAKHGLR